MERFTLFWKISASIIIYGLISNYIYHNFRCISHYFLLLLSTPQLIYQCGYYKSNFSFFMLTCVSESSVHFNMCESKFIFSFHQWHPWKDGSTLFSTYNSVNNSSIIILKTRINVDSNSEWIYAAFTLVGLIQGKKIFLKNCDSVTFSHVRFKTRNLCM